MKTNKTKGSTKSITNTQPPQSKPGPLPPKEWAMFDPTAFQDKEERVSLGDIFQKKAAPRNIESSSDLINFVEGEVSWDLDDQDGLGFLEEEKQFMPVAY